MPTMQDAPAYVAETDGVDIFVTGPDGETVAILDTDEPADTPYNRRQFERAESLARQLTRAARLDIAARGAVAALTQAATHPADVRAARTWLAEAIEPRT